MKYRTLWRPLVPVVAVAGLLAAALFAAEQKPAPTAKGPPPLKIDRSAPLLLDEPEVKEPASANAKMADNSACYVCHTNYQEEAMVGWHAKEKIGCIDCHGASDAHRNDEANITPPDIMYPTAKIDAACKKCHEEHNAAAKKVVARWQERCAQKTNPQDLVCTDCHGEHRLKIRVTRWDKTTRKLLSSTGNPSIKKTEKPAP